MGFHFQCPQGHLLQAEPTDMGRQSSCPYCGAAFIVPQPIGAVAMPQPVLPQIVQPFSGGSASGTGPEAIPVVRPSRTGGPVELPASADQHLIHIPCPNGHELEVPNDMLDQDALCPTCQVQFRLRAKDSLEHKRRQAEAFERRQYKLGQAWLNWSVIITVVVVIGLVVAIVIRASR